MTTLWESRVTAVGFKTAVASPLIAGTLRRIDALSNWQWDEVLEWQQRRFRRVLSTARRFTSYYRHPVYAQNDRSCLPILQKDVVRENRTRFRNRLVLARPVTTGGTGGRPVVVYVSHKSFFTEWAHIAYAWRFGGVSLRDAKITFRGSSLKRGFEKQRIIYQPTYNQLLVSPFHLNDDTFENLIARVREFPPRAIWGYPSAITTFAQWVLRNGPFKELESLRAILLASEASFEWQLRVIDEAFGAKIVRWYGQTEKVAFGAECQLGAGYHIVPTYGIVEVLEGKIVGSGFTNLAMPLIRYDTEDAGSLTIAPCSCGLPFPRLMNVTGRWTQEMLWGFGDEPISLTALNFHDPVFVEFSRFQFYQAEPGRVTLFVVPSTTTVDNRALASARDSLQRRVGDRLEIDVAVARSDDLLTERGKALSVVQRYRSALPK